VDEHPELGVAIPFARREPLDGGGDRIPPLRERDEDDERAEDSFKLNCAAGNFKEAGVYSRS
jgi:hypothetical protein